MENLGPKLGGALLILKKYAVHKCGHEGKPITASKCFISMIGKMNANHYIICTQDRDLQEKLRATVGVPLLYLHGKTPVLEQPSDTTSRYVKDKLSGVFLEDTHMIEELKLKNGIISEETKPRKKKIRGPNPLSCKKKVKKSYAVRSESDIKIDKKKRKIRIPQHVKDELLRNKS